MAQDLLKNIRLAW